MAHIIYNKFKGFYCRWCRERFYKTDKDGIAVCIHCGKKRSDGLNQIDENEFICVVCGCVFFNVLELGPSCPNGCKTRKKGVNEK